MSSTVRVFVGSTADRFVEETTFAHSLLSIASRAVEVWIIDGSTHSIRKFGSDERSPLPERWRGSVAGGTPFSYARFGAPELCGYEGRAIYTECDQLALDDICELWDLDLGKNAFAAVPYEATRRPASYQDSGWLSSVLVFDNSRCRGLDLVDIHRRVDQGEFDYREVIGLVDRFVETLDVGIAPLHPRWNDLNTSCEDTAILHFTDFDERPSLFPGKPDSDLWLRAYRAAFDAGWLSDADLAEARRLGGISWRVRCYPRLNRAVAPSLDRQWQRVEALARAARKRLGRLKRSVRAWAGRLREGAS